MTREQAEVFEEARVFLVRNGNVSTADKEVSFELANWLSDRLINYEMSYKNGLYYIIVRRENF